MSEHTPDYTLKLVQTGSLKKRGSKDIISHWNDLRVTAKTLPALLNACDQIARAPTMQAHIDELEAGVKLLRGAVRLRVHGCNDEHSDYDQFSRLSQRDKNALFAQLEVEALEQTKDLVT